MKNISKKRIDVFSSNIVDAIVDREKGTIQYSKNGVMMVSIVNRHSPKEMKIAIKETMTEMVNDILND